MPQDTAKYTPVSCYRCGETMRAYTFKDVWDMRIDGVLHKVPLVSVPCMRCDACDIAVTDGGSDDAIQWSYKKYITEQGLNTPWLRVRRLIRQQWWRIECRWNLWLVRRRKAAS